MGSCSYEVSRNRRLVFILYLYPNCVAVCTVQRCLELPQCTIHRQSGEHGGWWLVHATMHVPCAGCGDVHAEHFRFPARVRFDESNNAPEKREHACCTLCTHDSHRMRCAQVVSLRHMLLQTLCRRSFGGSSLRDAGAVAHRSGSCSAAAHEFDYADLSRPGLCVSPLWAALWSA